jgi:hypothetical protein
MQNGESSFAKASEDKGRKSKEAGTVFRGAGIKITRNHMECCEEDEDYE